MVMFLNDSTKMLKILRFVQCRGLTGAWGCSQLRCHSHANQKLDTSFGKDGHYDIIIVGGGGAGISLAGAISNNKKLADKKVLLLDGAPEFKGYNRQLYSNRVFSINRNTVNLMKSIGAWDTIQSIRCQPVKQMQVWDGLSDALITFNHTNFNEEVAYIVENDVLLYAILEQIEKNTNITTRNNSKIDKVRLQRDGFVNSMVYLKSGEVFSSELLVGADGANSLVRQQMGINNFTLNYNQMGIIATVELDETNENNVAWQRFLPNGVIALLPLSSNLSSIVWSTDTKSVKELLQLPESEFIEAVNKAFTKKYPRNQFVDNAMKAVDAMLGQYSQTVRQLPPRINGVYHKSRAGFPLGFGHASSYVGRGVALIGDAAHRIHPLAGMGLNLGFGDVKCLTETLAKAAYGGFSLGDLNYLVDYEKQRLQANVPIMVAVHGLQRLYHTDISPVVLLRSIGLQLTQAMTPVKQLFMKQAMG